MTKQIKLAQNTISQTELNDLCDWLKTGKLLTKGKLCLDFERQFAQWQGAQYAVFVNSGSSANLVMASALAQSGRLKNKKIIAPAVSWSTTVAPFLHLGFEVCLCECDRNDLGFCVDTFRELCERERPAVAILVHVLGHPNQMDAILEICHKYDILLLEDSCEALGSVYQKTKCGSFGLAGSFSFYYGHHISTIEGGMVVTDDEYLYNLMLSIRSHGWSRDVLPEYHEKWKTEYKIDSVRDLYTFYFTGFNLRSTDLNAFLGLSQMNKIDQIVKLRSDNFYAYKEELSDFWYQESSATTLSNFAYGVLVDNRMEVYEHLHRHNIETRPLICGNIGLHPFWIKQFGSQHFHFADIVHEYGLYLPNHAQLTHADIRHICKIFKAVAKPKF